MKDNSSRRFVEALVPGTEQHVVLPSRTIELPLDFEQFKEFMDDCAVLEAGNNGDQENSMGGRCLETVREKKTNRCTNDELSGSGKQLAHHINKNLPLLRPGIGQVNLLAAFHDGMGLPWMGSDILDLLGQFRGIAWLEKKQRCRFKIVLNAEGAGSNHGRSQG